MLGLLGHQPPGLPAGFAEKYTKETAASDDPAAFDTKAVYLSLADSMKTASIAAVDATADADLDQPRPVDARIRSNRGLGADAAGQPLADARRAIRPHPPQAGQAAVVLIGPSVKTAPKGIFNPLSNSALAALRLRAWTTASICRPVTQPARSVWLSTSWRCPLSLVVAPEAAGCQNALHRVSRGRPREWLCAESGRHSVEGHRSAAVRLSTVRMYPTLDQRKTGGYVV